MKIFGDRTIRVRAIPSLLKDTNLDRMINYVLKDLEQFGHSLMVEDLLDRVLMTFSCHTMVRANHKLEMAEMKALLESLDTIDFSVKCPHGRPIWISYALKDIEQRFGRI